MHPNLTKFIDQFEREAAKKGLYRNKLGKSELLFLENVWGPAFQFNYDGLEAEYPFKDFKGGQRFADFVYVKGGIRLLVEIDGFTTHAREISHGDFDDHLARQNDLILSGWMILRFSTQQVEKRSEFCQGQLKQAIGHWWSLTQGGFTVDEANLWMARKQLVIQMAVQRNGKVKPCEIAARFNISNRSAVNWMKRFEGEGNFYARADKKRSSVYTLASTAK